MFYRATVENNVDPESFGRVQVRVYGIHDEGSGVSTADLPWAEVSGGTDFGLVNGVGITSVLRIGTMVWVFFNNDDYNYQFYLRQGAKIIEEDDDGIMMMKF